MIRCENIVKIYETAGEQAPVLKNINFAIQKGEFVAIIGPSGSGKSTLMHILGALDRPTSGNYFLDGKNVFALSEKEMAAIRCARIGFVFQSFNLLARATVLRNVMLPLIYNSSVAKSERQANAVKALRAVDLEESLWTHLSNQLSGGQMQRVAIARALINNPGIILADEPTGNLDSKTGAVVLDTFRKLNKEDGHTIILITHDKTVAQRADRIIEIRDGEIVSDAKN